jgi:hypothetical protein
MPAMANGPSPPIRTGDAAATRAAGAGDQESCRISAVAVGEAEVGGLGASPGVGVSPAVGEGETETVGVAVGGGGSGAGFGVAGRGFGGGVIAGGGGGGAAIETLPGLTAVRVVVSTPLPCPLVAANEYAYVPGPKVSATE